MDTPVIQPHVTFKMLIFVRDVIQNITETGKTTILCKKIKIMNDYINILIPILNKNLNSQEIVTQLTTLNKKYNDNIGKRTVCDIIKRHILSNHQIYRKLISDLTEYIGLFIKGIEMFDDDASAIDERMRLSRENAKHISQLSELAVFVHCHGLCTLEPLSKKQKTEEEDKLLEEEEEGFEEIEPGIRCFKFTSAPLCMTENSSSGQDKYIAEFFIILDEYYKSLTLSDAKPDGESIFTNDINSTIVANYFICKFYKDYTCNMYKHVKPKFKTDTEDGKPIIEEYDDAICNASNRGFLYTYPISNAASYAYLPYTNETSSSLCSLLPTHTEDRTSAPHPSRVTVSNPGKINKIQRNKIYSVEDTQGSASLDIIILTSFKFNFAGDEISVAAGESLLALLLTLNTKYTAEMRKMIGLYQGRYGTLSPEGTYAYNFNESTSFSNISKGPKTTITSTSLRFLLFFFEQIGAKKATIFDFSCGVLDFTPEGQDQPEEVVSKFQNFGPTQPSQEMEIQPSLILGNKRQRGGMSPIFTKAYTKNKNTHRRKTKRRNKTNRKTKRRNKHKRKSTKNKRQK